MKDLFVTLAIHTAAKAQVLKSFLEKQQVEVQTEALENDLTKIAIRVKEEDLNRALVAIESEKLLSYQNENIKKIDDGKKRILVAVDFSEYSIKACQTAFNTAKVLDAKVKILHVYHNVYFPTNIPFADSLKEESDTSILDDARKKMLDLCNEIDSKISNKEFPSVNYSYSLREGLIQEEVENFVDEYQPTLLVIGTKGANHNNENLLGSVAADIIEMTNVPVLAVPYESTVKSIEDTKHIAFLSNFQERDMISFNTLVDFMKPYDKVRITLVHINQTSKKGSQWSHEQLQQVKQYFDKQYPALNIDYKLIEGEEVLDSVTDFVEHENVDVVALNTRRRNIFYRMFAPSMSRKVLYNSNVIILALRG